MITGVTFLRDAGKGHQKQGTQHDDHPLIASSSMDGSVKWWNLSAKGKDKSSLEGHKDDEGAFLAGHEDHILDIAISKSGTLVSAGGDDRYIKVWNVKEESSRFGYQLCPEVSIHAHR